MIARKDNRKACRKDFLLLHGHYSDKPFEWECISRNSYQSLVNMCVHLRIQAPFYKVTKAELIEILRSSHKFHSSYGYPPVIPGENRFKDSVYVSNTPPPEKKKKSTKVEEPFVIQNADVELDDADENNDRNISRDASLDSVKEATNDKSLQAFKIISHKEIHSNDKIPRWLTCFLWVVVAVIGGTFVIVLVLIGT